MHGYRRFLHTLAGVVLLAAMLLSSCANIASAQADGKGRTVRVGYMIYEGYQEGGEGEPKSGSAYEYYQKLRSYTGWEYEYVYGSISEMFAKLETGEIDIMSLVTYTEERAEKYAFSEESHGTEAFFLYVLADTTDISAEDFATFQGKTVGVLLGSYQEGYLRTWCEENSVPCQIVTYDYPEDLHRALIGREIDAMIDVRTLQTNADMAPWKSIHRFPAEPLYFAVSKSRPDILAELNEAMENIILADEYFAANLMEKYHEGTNYPNTFLTAEEQAYVDACGVLKVGYLKETNPLSFTDPVTGEMSGIAGEFLAIMSKTYGLTFETVAYKSEHDLLQALIDGELAFIFPIGCDYWTAENMGITLTSPVVSLPMSAVYQYVEGRTGFRTVAVIQGSATQESYVKIYYPDLKIVYVEDTKAALEAIESGLVDCYFVRSDYIDFMRHSFPDVENLYTVGLSYNRNIHIATTVENAAFSVILDKGISLLTDAQIEAAKIRYAYEDRNSLWQAIKDNWVLVFAGSVAMILLLVIVAVVSRLRINTAYMRVLKEERDKAEYARKAKTDFLFQMSHDIRTPMNAIVGFTNFIKSSNDLDAIHNDYAVKLENASGQLLMLINDVLEMSRIESGKLVFNREVHSIRSTVMNVVAVMQTQAEEKGLTLTTEIDVVHQMVNCDRNHLSRVVMNLLSNAVKFTPAGGKVRISLREMPESPAGFTAFELKVADNGIGMAPEFLQKVFEPFEREQTSTVSGLQGTGLGLSIVKRIVETAGDSITVESERDKGTVFTVSLCLQRAEEPAAKSTPAAQEDAPSQEHMAEYFRGKRILLVEDNEFNLVIAQAILETAGFNVETATDGRIAVNKVINAPVPDYYDAILMDIQMPVMNGYEATRAIRALSDGRAQTKILAVTANAFDTDRNDALAAGMDAHVAKPIDVVELYRTLWNIIGS